MSHHHLRGKAFAPKILRIALHFEDGNALPAHLVGLPKIDLKFGHRQRSMDSIGIPRQSLNPRDVSKDCHSEQASVP
jgi:hypothetical protein